MEDKIREYIRTWEGRCYVNGLPDEGPQELGDRVPSYKRICLAVLKNDVSLKSLGLAQPVSEMYGVLKRIELGIPEPKRYDCMKELLAAEIRAFKQAAVHVKINNILPILEYVKIEPGLMTRNCLNSFLTMTISYKGKPFLIEQRILMNFIDKCHADHIEVLLNGDSVTLKSDNVPSVKSATMNLKDFPVCAEPDTEAVPLVTEQINIATRFIDEKLTPERENIFIGDGFVRGCNGFIGYSAPCQCTTTFMDRATCAALAKLPEVKYSQNKSYHFFEAPGLMYGFVKTEYKYLDISSFFGTPDIIPFEVEKEAWIQFNDMAIANAVSKVALTTMVITPNQMSLSMSDDSYNIKQTGTVPIKGGEPYQFKYDPALMNRLLKAVPDDSLTVYPIKGRLHFTGEGGWAALIMQLVLPPNN